MRAKDIMSTGLVTVGANTQISEAIALMLKHHVSGLPVVAEDGGLMGIVSEEDFLRREEMQTLNRERWLEWLLRPAEMASTYAHTRGRMVADVMTAGVVTAKEDSELGDVVDLMQKNRINRVPILREGRLVGIVTRSDLMRALMLLAADPYEDVMHTDAEIRSGILAEISRQSWTPAETLEIDVNDGVVTLSGTIPDDSLRDGLRVLASNVAGVKQVVDQMALLKPQPSLPL